MLRFLVSSYSLICEICLWLFFLGAAISGWYAGELGGAIIGLIGAFLFGVFFIAPFAMLDDIRKSTLRMERMGQANLTKSVSSNHSITRPETASSPSTNTSVSETPKMGRQVGDRIKVYKGKEIFKEDDGVSVDGKKYSGLIEAEKAISQQS